jgi:ABC-type amino acid transport substrate-binding protein
MNFLGVSGLVQFNTNVTDRINGSYYLSQNSQNYSNSINFVPVLGYSDYNGWYRYTGMNLIIWPGDTLIIPSDNAKLNGISLRIGVISSVPYTIVSILKNQSGVQNKTFTGYMPDLINILQTKIGFISNIELTPSNLTYDQVVQAVADGIYDIVVADVTATSARTEIVDFSSSIYDTSLVIVMRKTPNMNSDMLLFLKPFSLNLWLFIFVSTIVSGIVFCLLEREDNEALQGRSIIYAFGMSMWYSFCNIVGHEAGFNARTSGGRVLSVGIYSLSVVLVASYIANLVSYLTISKSANSITGLDDIKNGMIQFNRIGILVGSASEEFYLEEISDGRQSFNPMQSLQEIFDCLLNGTIDVSFIDIGTAQYVTNNVYCNLTIVGDGFDENIMGIVMPKQWLYERDLDVNVLALRESADLDQLKSKWFDTTNCSSSSEASDAIEIESMGGLFLVFTVFGSLSLLFFAWKKYKL